MPSNPYDNHYLKKAYTSGLSNIDSKSNELWDYLKGSTASNTQQSQDYQRYVNDYLGSIQADKTAVTGRVDDLTGTIKADKNKLHGKYDRLEDYQYNYNPYTSDIGQSILANFKWQGKNASDHAVADSGAGNGGNIDSFAAANAARQQLSFDVAGHNAALNDYNSRVGGIQQTLRDLGNYNLGTYDATNRGIESIVNQNSAGYAAGGQALQQLHNSNLASQAQGAANFDNFMQVLGFMGNQNQQVFGNDMLYNQQQFDNDQTSQNNQMLRYAQEAAITGYVPDALSQATKTKNNPYIALVSDPSVDFAARIEARQAEMEKSTDPTMRQAIYDDIRLLNEARDYKITNVDGNGNYANTLNKYLTPRQSTASMQLAREGNDLQKLLTQMGYDYNTKESAEDRTLQELLAKMGYDFNLDYLGKQIASTEKINTENNAATLEQLLQSISSGERINTANNANSLDMLMRQLGANAGVSSANRSTGYSTQAKQTNEDGTASAQKPTITAAQTLQAVENGIITDEVRTALDYYYGANAYEKYFAPAMNETKIDNIYYDVSAGAAEYLDALRGKTPNESELRNDIIEKSKTMDISVADAKKISEAFGYDVNWWDSKRDYNKGNLIGYGKEKRGIKDK